MKILVVSPVFPQRRAGGFGLRTLGILRELAVAHEVHLLSLCSAERESAPTPADLDEIRKLVGELTLHELSGPPRGVGARLEMARDRIPPRARAFCADATRTAFREAIARGPDIVLFESAFTAVLADLVPGSCPVVLDAHNVEYLLLKRSGRPRGLHPLRAARWRWNWRLLRRFERRMMREADLVFTTSEVDRSFLRRLDPRIPIEVIPNGVRLCGEPQPRAAERPGRLLIHGLMDYPPNVDAALWFGRQIFPRLRERCPEVELVISGARPATRVRELDRQAGITVTGEVPEMEREIDQAALVIVPLRQGSGTRLKIIEAWSRRKAVVATTLGCEGLSFSPGTDLVLANRPADFVARIDELLASPALRERIGQSGYETAQNRYSWSNIGRILREHLDQLTQA